MKTITLILQKKILRNGRSFFFFKRRCPWICYYLAVLLVSLITSFGGGSEETWLSWNLNMYVYVYVSHGRVSVQKMDSTRTQKKKRIEIRNLHSPIHSFNFCEKIFSIIYWHFLLQKNNQFNYKNGIVLESCLPRLCAGNIILIDTEYFLPQSSSKIWKIVIVVWVIQFPAVIFISWKESPSDDRLIWLKFFSSSSFSHICYLWPKNENCRFKDECGGESPDFIIICISSLFIY